VTYSLPLFPLHTVLCPGIALPLHIFEPRYRAMIGRCLEEDAPFGVVLIRDGRETGGLAGRIAEVGTAARIRQVGRYADGRMDIVTIGVRRFRVHALDTAREAWLTGIVEDLDDPLGGSAEDAAALADRAGRRFLDYLARVQEGDGRVVLPGSADAPGGQGAGAGAATGLADRDGPDAADRGAWLPDDAPSATLLRGSSGPPGPAVSVRPRPAARTPRTTSRSGARSSSRPRGGSSRRVTRPPSRGSSPA